METPYKLIENSLHPEKFNVVHLDLLHKLFIDGDGKSVPFRGFSREKLLKNASAHPVERANIEQAIKHAVEKKLMKEHGNPENSTYEVHLTEDAAKGIIDYLAAYHKLRIKQEQGGH